MDAGEDDAADASAADKAVVPAKIVVENEVEGFRLTGDERLPGAVLDFGFEAAAAHGSCDASVGVEEGLGADFLRAGAFDVRDDAEGYGFVGRRGCCEDFVERGHDLSLADGRNLDRRDMKDMREGGGIFDRINKIYRIRGGEAELRN